MSYYTVLKDINKIECLECGRRLCGIRTSTMRRHYKLVHKKIIGNGNSLSYDGNQKLSDDETCDNEDENSFQTKIAHTEENPLQNENYNEDDLEIPKVRVMDDSNGNTYSINQVYFPERPGSLSDQDMPPRKKLKNSPAVNHNKTSKNGKYDWLGNLVVSQIEDIDSTNRADFIWDVQCLVRKYLVKPAKLPNENAQSSRIYLTETTATPTNDVTFKKGSNVSFNVNFV